MHQPPGAASQTPLSARHAWYALGILVLVAVFNFIDRLSLYILQVQIKEELGLSDSQLGALTGVAFSVIYSVLAIPIARLADRSVRKHIIVISLAVWSVMTALCGFATGFISLMILRVGVAIGEAGSLPASHSLISDYFRRDQRATALALWSLSIPLGQMLGFGLSGWLGSEFGWRGAFIVLGVASFVLVPVVLVTMKEPQRGAIDGVLHVPREAPPLWESTAILWRSPAIRNILLGGALNAYVLYTILNWNAPFYSRVHGFSMGELAGYLAVIAGVGTGLGMLVGGLTADRLGKRDPRWRMRVPLITSLGFAPLLFIQYFAANAYVSLIVGVFSFMLGHAFYPSMLACVQTLAPPNLRAFAASIMMLAINILGMSLGPLFTGMISDYLIANHDMATDSLRYAITASSIFALWGAYHFYKASNHLLHEMPIPDGGRISGETDPSLPVQTVLETGRS